MKMDAALRRTEPSERDLERSSLRNALSSEVYSILEAEYSRKVSLFANYENEVRELKEKREASRLRIRELTDMNAKLSDRYKQLLEKLGFANKDLREAAKTYKDLRDRIEDGNNFHEELIDQVKEIQMLIDLLNSRISDTKALALSIDSAVDTAGKKGRDLQQQISASESRLQEVLSQNASIESEIKQIESKKAEVEEELGSINKSLEVSEADRDAMIEGNRKLAESLEKVLKDIDSASKKYSSITEKLSHCEQKNKDMIGGINEIDSRRTAMSERLTELCLELANQDENLVCKKHSIDTVEFNLKSLGSKLNTEEMGVSRLRSQRDKIVKEISSKQERCKSVNENIDKSGDILEEILGGTGDKTLKPKVPSYTPSPPDNNSPFSTPNRNQVSQSEQRRRSYHGGYSPIGGSPI